MKNYKKDATDKLVFLVRRILKTTSEGTILINKKPVNIDITKKTVTTRVVEEKCEEIVNLILLECSEMLQKELDKRMTLHIEKRHRNDK